jgi:hypothetical protein
MSDTFTAAFEMLYDSLPAAQVEVKRGADTISVALSSGSQREWVESEQGVYPGADFSVRYLYSAEPSGFGGDSVIGKTVSVKDATGAWVDYRVSGRNLRGGVVSLALTSEYGER